MNNQEKNQKEETNQLSRRMSPITKITTSSRPFSRIKSVTGQRKKPWNRRFIYNKMPDYYSIKDKNVIIAKKIRLNSVNKKNIFDSNYITYQQSKRNKRFLIKPFSRTMSGFLSNYNRATSNEYTTNRNLISPLTYNAHSRNNLMKNSNTNVNLNINVNEGNFNKIKKLWNELCVYSSYRELFMIIYNQLSGDEKEQIYKNELNDLTTVKNDVKTLIYYIDQRNLVLRELYEENKNLNKKRIDINDINDILKEISDLIEKLRECTIDVCYAMKKLKNDINNVNNLSKYNFDLLASKNKFDKNYLIKMKGELSFLKEGNAKYYFNLSDIRTPFLLKASEANINMINNINLDNNDKDFLIKIVPLKEKTKEHIAECSYYIYQELIAYQQNILIKKTINRGVTPSNNRTHIENKDINISKNLVINDSLINRKKSQKTINDYSDINSAISSKNIFREKNLKSFQILLNQRFNTKKNKDLFSQKLLSGYILKDVVPYFPLEDKKVKEEEEEKKEKEKEKSGDNNSENESNDLIEEKRSETENNENSKMNSNGESKEEEESKISSSDNKIKEEESSYNKTISLKLSEKHLSNKQNKYFNNINNNLNEDINQYLNNDIKEIDNFNINKDENNIKDNDKKSYNENNTINNIINNIKNSEDKVNNNMTSEKKISKNEDIINDFNEDEIIHNLEMNKNNIIKEKDNNENIKKNNIEDNKNKSEKNEDIVNILDK